MKLTYVKAEVAPNTASFSDKIMGEFSTHEQVEDFVGSLEQMDIDEIQLLEGRAGEGYLAQLRNSISGFLDFMLGDLETEMLHEYELALAAGHIVFVVPHGANHADEIVRMAQHCGAQHVAHFGNYVNTSY